MDNDDARVALFREHPPAWWGWPWRLPRPLTVAELIACAAVSTLPGLGLMLSRRIFAPDGDGRR
jgi:hypothetical protein